MIETMNELMLELIWMRIDMPSVWVKQCSPQNLGYSTSGQQLWTLHEPSFCVVFYYFSYSLVSSFYLRGIVYQLPLWKVEVWVIVIMSPKNKYIEFHFFQLHFLRPFWHNYFSSVLIKHLYTRCVRFLLKHWDHLNVDSFVALLSSHRSWVKLCKRVMALWLICSDTLSRPWPVTNHNNHYID